MRIGGSTGTVAGVGWLLGCLALGCGREPAPPGPNARAGAAVAIGRDFDPTRTGTVQGRVVWRGSRPGVPAFRSVRPAPDGISLIWDVHPNPHAPRIQPDGSLAGAVVFLRGVEPTAGRPWDLPPVRVEMNARRIALAQGAEGDALVGFIRRGDPIEMVSREPVFHALRAAGSAFFSLAFPDPDRPLRRRLTAAGTVELSSAAGYFWARAHLFVTDHPYYARADAAGRFALPRVPAGQYELVCWHPNWHMLRQERNPESCLVERHYFQPPVERSRPIAVEAGVTHEVELALSAGDFGDSPAE